MHSPNSAHSFSSRRIESAVLTLLFALEALIFYSQARDQIAPYYPTNFDQAGYASYAYQLYEDIRTMGWMAVAHEIANPSTATGVALIIQGALLSLISGASRVTLVSLNLIYFIALQVVLFETVRKRTASAGMAFSALALLLATNTIFQITGGIFDFRMDFVAFCLYGICTCLLVHSRCFLDAKTTAALTAVAILLVATRSLTIVYLGGVWFGLFALLTWSRSRTSRATIRAFALRRLKHLVWSGAVLLTAASPLLFAARQKLYEKYVVGHVLNDEKYIRAQEMQVEGVLDHIWFYPRSIIHDHYGRPALVFIALLAMMALIGAALRPRGLPEMAQMLQRQSLALFTLALAVIVPVVPLAIDIAKSTVVGGIVTIPGLLFAILVIAAATPRRAARPAMIGGSGGGKMLEPRAQQKPYRHLLAWRCSGMVVTSLIVCATSLFAFVLHANTSQHDKSVMELDAISGVNDAIARYAVSSLGTAPVMSVDRVSDVLHPGTVQIAAYERYRRLPHFERGLLGDDIFASSEEDALGMVARSDIVVLTDPVRGRESPYPMNDAIKHYWSRLKDYATERMRLLDERDIGGVPYRTYVRPNIRISGASAGWITSTGISLTVEPMDLKRWPLITLNGKAPYEALGGEPVPTATLINDSGTPVTTLPVTFKRMGDGYEIAVDTRSQFDGSESQKSILLTFDRSFVPARLGINPDVRELVVQAPTRTELR